MSYAVGHRHGSDPAMLWLLCRPVVVAPIQPLAWEPPYAMGVALEMAKRQKKKKMLKPGSEGSCVSMCQARLLLL